MIIGLDIDDTLTSGRNGIQLINEWFGIDYDTHPNKQFDLTKMLGITKEEEAEFWKQNYDRFVSEAELNELAIPMIDELKRLGGEFVLVTARPESTADATIKWAKEKLPIDVKDFAFIGGHNKADALDSLKVRLFVDDRAENIHFIKGDSRLQDVVTAIVPKYWSKGANADLLVNKEGKFEMYTEEKLVRAIGERRIG